MGPAGATAAEFILVENWGLGGNGCRACPAETEALGGAAAAVGRCGSRTLLALAVDVTVRAEGPTAPADDADGRVARVAGRAAAALARGRDGEVFVNICEGRDIVALSISLASALRFCPRPTTPVAAFSTWSFSSLVGKRISFRKEDACAFWARLPPVCDEEVVAETGDSGADDLPAADAVCGDLASMGDAALTEDAAGVWALALSGGFRATPPPGFQPTRPSRQSRS